MQMIGKQHGETTSSGGIGIFGLMGVIFVVLKIIDIKPIGDWSWWWVTAPFWGGFIFVFVLLMTIFVIKEMSK